MIFRPPKESDQDETEKAFQFLQEFMASHSEIEPTLWGGALWSCLVAGHAKSGVTYQEFCTKWSSVMKHYKSWFDGSDEENLTRD